MADKVAAAPEFVAGTWVWRAGVPDVAEVLFTGRGPWAEREEMLAQCVAEAPPVAWARQVHSARVLVVPAGESGEVGEADALVAAAGVDVALCVVAADCVPVLLAGPEGIAAVHAGWRGLAAGVIPATLARVTHQLLGSGPAEREPAGLARWRAWIGPAIGPCCYEVGEEVAAQVAAACGSQAGSQAAAQADLAGQAAAHTEIVVAGPGGRPHLDLQAAARRQLAAAGVGEIATVAVCTRCRGEWLYSYRREGRGVGRNLAFVWRRPRGARSKARS